MLIQSVTVCYYKVRQVLQSMADFITKSSQKRLNDIKQEKGVSNWLKLKAYPINDQGYDLKKQQS